MLTDEQIGYIANFKWYAIKKCRDPNLAQDIIQETYYNILKRDNNFINLSGKDREYFVRRVISNVYIDMLRPQKKFGRILSVEEDINIAEHYYMPNKFHVKPEVFSKMQLKEVVTTLSQSSYGKCLLYVNSGYKYKEVASSLKLPINTIGTQCHIARRNINSIYN